MNFSELQFLGEKLQAEPPSFAVSPARELLLRQIDVLFGEADSEYSAALSKFYSARVDKILDEAAAYSGDIHEWEFSHRPADVLRNLCRFTIFSTSKTAPSISLGAKASL